jgi:hypothetical protein
MKRKKNYTKRITVALTLEERALIETMAIVFDCDNSDVIRNAVRTLHRTMSYRMEQCDCGGYRPQVFSEGEWRWGSGCVPCEEIRLLREGLK